MSAADLLSSSTSVPLHPIQMFRVRQSRLLFTCFLRCRCDSVVVVRPRQRKSFVRRVISKPRLTARASVLTMDLTVWSRRAVDPTARTPALRPPPSLRA
eukprot:772977-Pyramimonas_sp.AAC.1